jgi:sugar lactone lactonase YvrE
MPVELLIDARADLGEGPAWEARTQTLYWLDIYGRQVHCWRAGQDQSISVDDMPGCLAPRPDGHLIVGLPGRIADLDPGTGRLHTLHTLADEPAGNRVNDGKCDPLGRFLLGTMDNDERSASGSLYSYDRRGLRQLQTGIGISNGLAWSPDSGTLYYIDTPTRKVQAFDYDLASGALANPRAAFEVPESLGWPDGMTSDTDGRLWIAMWGGAQVTRWDPDSGRLLEQIPVPALQSSSCVFGGPDMNELYITSARKSMSAAQLAEYPLSGGVFRLKTRATGLPTFEFAG